MWCIYLTISQLYRRVPSTGLYGYYWSPITRVVQSTKNSPTNTAISSEGAAAPPSRDEGWWRRAFKSRDLDSVGSHLNVSLHCGHQRINALPVLRKSKQFSCRQVGHSRNSCSSNFIHGDRQTLIGKAAKSQDKDIWQRPLLLEEPVSKKYIGNRYSCQDSDIQYLTTYEKKIRKNKAVKNKSSSRQTPKHNGK